MLSNEEARRRFDSLGKREKQIAMLLLQGITVPKIALRILKKDGRPLDKSTVRWHKSQIYLKLGITDLSQSQIQADKLFYDIYQPLVSAQPSQTKAQTESRTSKAPEQQKSPPRRAARNRRTQIPAWVGYALLAGLLVLIIGLAAYQYFNKPGVFLSDHYPLAVQAAGDNFCIGKDPIGTPPVCIFELTRNGKAYPHSIFAHANSVVVYDLAGQFEELQVDLLLMGSACGDGAVFSIFLDDVGIYQSALLTHYDDPVRVRLSVSGGRILRLETSIGPNGNLDCDGTVWGEPWLTVSE